MYYLEDGDNGFATLTKARAHAIKMIPYYRDMGETSPRIRIYSDAKHKNQIGFVALGLGQPVWISNNPNGRSGDLNKNGTIKKR